MPSPRVGTTWLVVAFVVGALLALMLVDRALRFDSQAVATGVTLASTIVTAAATAVLAWFAGVQVWREKRADERRSVSITRRLTGAAWLARRSCEVILHGSVHYWNFYSVAAQFFGHRRPLDRLEAHFREVLALSSTLGGEPAAHGARAFEGFLAASDRMNDALVGSMTPGHDTQMVNEALMFLYDAVVELEQLAPRRAHETPLPDPMTLRPAPPSPSKPPAPSIPPAVTPPPSP